MLQLFCRVNTKTIISNFQQVNLTTYGLVTSVPISGGGNFLSAGLAKILISSIVAIVAAMYFPGWDSSSSSILISLGVVVWSVEAGRWGGIDVAHCWLLSCHCTDQSNSWLLCFMFPNANFTRCEGNNKDINPVFNEHNYLYLTQLKWSKHVSEYWVRKSMLFYIQTFLVQNMTRAMCHLWM